MSTRKRIKIVVLDFDGTLVASNDIKHQAFDEIFSEWPEHKSRMMEWHYARNTVDRVEKFKYFVEEVLMEKRGEKLVLELAKRFSDLTRIAIIQCPMIEGALEFLNRHYQLSPLFLVSATPQKELEYILGTRGLMDFFKKVFGAPINKKDTLAEILSMENVSSKESIYIGDSHEDQAAASFHGIEFIGIRSSHKLENQKKIFPDFVSLNHYLDENYELS